MQDLQGKVAVVTGAASGIGRAIAERFAEEGMKIVLADVEEGPLKAAEAEMKLEGADVLAVKTDVSKCDEVEALAQATVKAYRTAHILVNNAGVGMPGAAWEISQKDWEWVLGVNLWGVIHGIRAFVPIMLEHGEPGHIINTASIAGLTSGGGMSPYNVSKHGVVTLSECLHHDLRAKDSLIQVSVLCPGWVDTRINESDRNRPIGPVADDDLDDGGRMVQKMIGTALKGGLPPREVAELVLRAVIENKFYILPHPHWKNMIEGRMRDILEERTPMVVVPPDA